MAYDFISNDVIDTGEIGVCTYCKHRLTTLHHIVWGNVCQSCLDAEKHEHRHSLFCYFNELEEKSKPKPKTKTKDINDLYWPVR